MAETGKSYVSRWELPHGPPCWSRIPSNCSNKDELGQCNSWLRWAWERKIWWQEMQKWLGVLAFLSFQCKDVWKGLSPTERPSHGLLWWNLQPPNNTASCVFPDVIGICTFSHHGNLTSSSHPTAFTTWRSAVLLQQRVGGLLILCFQIRVSGKLLFLLSLNYVQADILLLCSINGSSLINL